MTQEQKELLLKDLCGRLPYGVNIRVHYEEMSGSGYFDETVWRVDNDEPFHVNDDKWIEDIKPYLHPMESMTEEEINEFILISDTILRMGNKRSTCILSLEQMDWLNKKMFDYRGLIPMGIALEAPKDMYKN
jgi:hypothetical protein